MAETPKFELPAIVRERLQAASAGPPQLHPEPDMLAAFSERTLPDSEREQILAHLAACDRCREVLALIAPEEGPPRLAVQTVVERAGFSWRTLRWGALAAAIALVAVLTIPRLERAKSPQTAAVRPFSDNAPALAQAKPTQTESQLQASNAPVLNSKLSAPERAGNKEFAPPTSRFDYFKAESKAANSTNGPAMFDRDLGKAKILANGGPAMNNANTATAETGATFGSVAGLAGGVMKSKQATPPSPASPASEPNAATSYKADQTVEVTSAAPLVNSEAASVAPARNEATAKKDQATVAAAQKQAAPPAKTATSSSADTITSTALTQRNVAQLALMPAAPLWRVHGGKLQHSSGTAWQPIEVDNGVRLTAVFAFSQDVWAGGQNLVVYHSSDGGANWTKSQIQPALNNVKNGRITKMSFSDAVHGQLFVRGEAPDGSQAEDLWISNDGGKTWLYETID